MIDSGTGAAASRGRGAGRVALLLALALSPAAPLSRGAAQSEPRLVAAVQLAQDGLGDSARSTIDRILASLGPTDTLYPQALYARALVTSDPEQRRRDLQRVVVEYAYSTWADDALLQLAQLDVAAGDPQGAVRNLERLRLDHPATPLFATAAFWAGRTYFELRDATSACRWLSEGLSRVGDDVELRNQLDYYHQRCADVGGGAAGQRDSRAVSAGPPSGGAAGAEASRGGAPGPETQGGGAAGQRNDGAVPAEARGAGVTGAGTESAGAKGAGAKGAGEPAAPAKTRFRIQVAAVNSQAAAEDIAARVRAAGYEAIIVREKNWFKVRAGSFATRADALAALPALQAKFRSQPFVVAGQ